MTDEEKKEFEDFQQWKKEKAQKEEQERNLCLKKNERETNSQNHNEFSPKKFWAVVIIIIIVICLFIALTSNYEERKQVKQQVKQQEEQLIQINKSQAISDSLNKVKQKQEIKDHIFAVKHSIRIRSAYVSSPNSANGVDAYFNYKNIGKKTIKYLTWHGYPINAVGDAQTCEIQGYSDFDGKDTGPIRPGRNSTGYWDCAWYNSTIKKLVLTGVSIEYMDGTTLEITKDELKYIR